MPYFYKYVNNSNIANEIPELWLQEDKRKSTPKTWTVTTYYVLLFLLALPRRIK